MNVQDRIKTSRIASVLWLALSMVPLAAGCQVEAAGGPADSTASDAEEVKGGGGPKGSDCGGLLGLTCGRGLFCDYELEAMCGAFDMTGTCAPIPKACTREYNPVCGCDGKTYGNECTANAAGVSVASLGECKPAPEPEEEACGGFLGLECKPGSFCLYAPDAMCGAADMTGTCVPIPDVCTKEYNPVCGCDGNTYSNACMANAAGVSAASPGECGAPEPGRVCGTRGAAACDPGFFCDFPPSAECGTFDAPGTCAPIPEACTFVYSPVCGCDGTTYSNECMANAAGVSVASRGECGSPEPGKICGGIAGFTCDDPGTFCNYSLEAMCGAADMTGSCDPIPEACTEEYDPVCGCDDKTYGNACAANAAGVSVALRGECPARP